MVGIQFSDILEGEFCPFQNVFLLVDNIYWNWLLWISQKNNTLSPLRHDFILYELGLAQPFTPLNLDTKWTAQVKVCPSVYEKSYRTVVFQHSIILFWLHFVIWVNIFCQLLIIWYRWYVLHNLFFSRRIIHLLGRSCWVERTYSLWVCQRVYNGHIHWFQSFLRLFLLGFTDLRFCNLSCRFRLLSLWSFYL